MSRPESARVALRPVYAGVRPKIVGRGAPGADFRVGSKLAHGVPGLVNLLGIESLGLTDAFGLAEHVAALLK
jgi:L-2-hydroxyglutarate oxidase LhgO